MQTLNSDYRALCPVRLPYKGRQKYMHTFKLADPAMPRGYQDYLPIVVALCRVAGATRGWAHMTVDEKVVRAGRSQRRPGPHVDGCFMPAAGYWGHDDPGPHWAHHCNAITAAPVPGRMPVIVAASAVGCRAWRGVFQAQPGGDGDLAHAAHLLGEGETLPAGRGYLLSADCVHESLPMVVDTRRSFLRIALPVDFEY